MTAHTSRCHAYPVIPRKITSSTDHVVCCRPPAAPADVPRLQGAEGGTQELPHAGTAHPPPLPSSPCLPVPRLLAPLHPFLAPPPHHSICVPQAMVANSDFYREFLAPRHWWICRSMGKTQAPKVFELLDLTVQEAGQHPFIHTLVRDFVLQDLLKAPSLPPCLLAPLSCSEYRDLRPLPGPALLALLPFLLSRPLPCPPSPLHPQQHHLKQPVTCGSGGRRAGHLSLRQRDDTHQHDHHGNQRPWPLSDGGRPVRVCGRGARRRAAGGVGHVRAHAPGLRLNRRRTHHRYRGGEGDGMIRQIEGRAALPRGLK